jgi:hypothetical protein
MQDAASASQPLDGVAWYHSQNTDAFIALQNTTQEEITALPTLFVFGQVISLGKRQLKSHEAVNIKIPPTKGVGNKDRSYSAGVRIEYDGQPGAIVAQGWVIDERIGFSAPFAFRPKSNCDCSGDTQHLYGTGVEIGSAGGMMGLAPGAIFSPYLVARNRSYKPISVVPVFKYSTTERIEKVTLPRMLLSPQESKVVNLKEYQDTGIIPPWVPHGNIDLQYKGEVGALIAELASVDQNGSFVSPVPLTCNGNQDQRMAFWRTDGDWHSSVTIENVISQESDLEITISYPGEYMLLKGRSRPGKRRWFRLTSYSSLRNLIAQAVAYLPMR